MEQVSVFDAKSRLSALLAAVESGDEITITRRGKPVARLVPIREDTTGAVERLAALQARIAARGQVFTWHDLKRDRDSGRR